MSVDDPLYISGKYVNIGSTQGKKQTGCNNPNFKGYYHTPYGVFSSYKEFRDTTGRDYKILSRCKNNQHTVNFYNLRSPLELASKADLGKTWESLGWYMEYTNANTI